jgi:Ca2+-binding RTX toxin-like protein
MFLAITYPPPAKSLNSTIDCISDDSVDWESNSFLTRIRNHNSMAYNPLSISSSATTVPFANAVPIRYIWVSPTGSNSNSGSASAPMKTIQAAVDKATPGTAVMVKSGNYRENVELKTDGTTTKPIWLTSADGVGAAKIIAADNNQSVIRAHGEDNWILKGFETQGGKNGIQFSQSGTNLTNLTQNVVIQENIIKNVKVADGIKLSQAKGFSVVGNRIEGGIGEEGIDNVYVVNSIFAYNTIINTNGLSGITVKAGSLNVQIHHNYIKGVSTDGIVVGGWSSLQGKSFPNGINFEAKNITVAYNEIHDVGKRPLNVLGGQDSVIKNNWFNPDNNYPTVVNVGPDNIGFISKNLNFQNNIVSKDNWLIIAKGQGAIYHSGNVKVGPWTERTGYDDLPVLRASGSAPSVGSRDWQESGKWTISLKGTDKVDTLNGTSHNDLIDGGRSQDTMIGGSGDDTYIVSTRFEKIIEKTGQGIDTAMLWDTEFHLPAEVENLVISTKAGAKVRDNVMDNIFTAGAGKDTFNFIKANGHDAIKGFVVGQDHIQLDASVSADQVNTFVNAGNLVLDLVGDNSITLLGVTSTSNLHQLFT